MAPQQGYLEIEREDLSQSPVTISKTEKILQQQLVLILHAHNCQAREILEKESNYKCNLPYCQVMKNTISHMRSCTEVEDCNFEHCESSRELISHWKSCARKDCSVCAPVRRIAYRKYQLEAN